MSKTSSHIHSQFDEDLTVLRDLVLRMGGLVEDQLEAATAALQRGDSAGARAVIEGDREIDRIELRCDEEAARLLALRAPLGVDLRTVLTLTKTVNDLERIGDEAKKIARAARDSADDGRDARSLPMLDSILGMADIARTMLHNALNALVRLDLTLASHVGQDDDRQDAAFRAAKAEGRAAMQASSENIDAALEMIFVAKSLERIADHAKNIASYVFYLVEGRDVRHPKLER